MYQVEAKGEGTEEDYQNVISCPWDIYSNHFTSGVRGRIYHTVMATLCRFFVPLFHQNRRQRSGEAYESSKYVD